MLAQGLEGRATAVAHGRPLHFFSTPLQARTPRETEQTGSFVDIERCTGSGRFRRCSASHGGAGDGKVWETKALFTAIGFVIASLTGSVAWAQPAEQPPANAPPASGAATAPPPAEAPLIQAQPPAAQPPAAPPADDLAALRAEVRALRAEVDARNKEPQTSYAAPPATPTPAKPDAAISGLSPKPLGYEEFWPWVLPPDGLSVGGFVQAQYENHEDSQDQLNANGGILNKDRFSIRRARVSATGEWEYAAVTLQLDANTTNGPQVDLRKAEASLQYRPDRSKPPMIMATLGLFDIPFGFENVEASHTRYFMEPSTASQALFPGQADLGVRLAGALGFFRYTLALQNGEPIGEATPYVAQDPNAAKDVIARFGFDSQPSRRVQVAGGVSGLTGTGFHPGILASGPSLGWRDTNGNGVVDTGNGEIVGVPAQSATPSQNFNRWAVGADLRTSIRWWPGVLKLYGELILAQNLDRGQYVADPILTGQDQRELGFYVAALQEVTRWGIVGIRYDYYDPNSNFFDKRGGSLIPSSEVIQTVSPLVGLVLPDRARLLFQYDFISNSYARSAIGIPTQLADNVLTLRLQVQL
jgi:hypothetical protein